MKKYFNEKHEAIIDTRLYPVSKNPKDREIQPMKQEVNNIKMYNLSEDGKYHQVWISRDTILELANHIKEIESTEITAMYDAGLPF